MKSQVYFRAIAFLLIGVAATTSLAGATVKLFIPNAGGTPGSTVKIPLQVQGSQDLGALQFNLIYDSEVIEPTDVTAGDLFSGLVDFNVVSPGQMRLAMATSEGINGDGELLLMTFKVLGGSQSSLSLESVQAWEQATSFEMMVTVQSGMFTVGGGLGFPIWLIALVGIIVVALVIILLAKSRRPAPTAGTQQASPATPVPGMTTNPASARPMVRPVARPLQSTAQQLPCRQCGEALESGSKFCNACGSRVPVSVTCSRCGQPLGASAKFCTRCGEVV